MNVAFLFPGQGSLAAGELKSLLQKSPRFGALLQRAATRIDCNLNEVISSVDRQGLPESRLAQPLILTYGYSRFLDISEQFGLKPKLMAGHSLGEYTALLAAGSLTFEDAVALVYQRGTLMDAAASSRGGIMVAVTGVSVERLREACSLSSIGSEIAVVANRNSPSQTVIAGTDGAVRAVIESLSLPSRGAVPLDVSGAFHSPLMQDAVIPFGEILNRVHITSPSVGVISSVTGCEYKDPSHIKATLLAQLTAEVCWTDVVNALMRGGINTIIDIGPRAILKGLVLEHCDGKRQSGRTLFVWAASIGKDADALESHVSQVRKRVLQNLVRECICARNRKCHSQYDLQVLRPVRMLQELLKRSETALVSPSEVEAGTRFAVAALAAKGYSNNEIADRIDFCKWEE
jgi:[acyl-carrier-protein] S-malonyltransferase